MTAYIFIGPTISVSDAAVEFDAVYLPPVAQGDVIRVMAHRPSAIGIVDGFFEREPAVWHKEILWALSEGVPVFGSASMGALRAAELAAFGMEGVGGIFQGFLGGELEDDDEVAVAHAEASAGFAPMSEAMVVVRATLARAEEERVIGAADRRVLERIGKALFYADRIWPAILAGASREGVAAETIARLRTWLPRGRCDSKRADAIAMLRRMRAHAAAGSPPVTVDFEFEHTEWWYRAHRTAGELHPDELIEADGHRILDEVRLSGLFPKLRSAAVLGALARQEARRARITPGDDLRRAVAADLGAPNGDGDAEAWRLANGLSERRFEELVSDQATVRWVEQTFRVETVRRAPDLLRIAGDYAPLLARARAKEEALADAGLLDAGPGATGMDREALLRWHLDAHRGGAGPTDPDGLAREAGYPDVDALVRSLVREYLYLRLIRQQTASEAP